MGILQFEKVTKDVEVVQFDCGVDSINEYVKNSYYPFVTQHAYTYSIVSKGTLLGYYQILLRDIELGSFPENIAEYDPGIKEEKISAVHIRFIAIDKKYQGHKIGTGTLQTIIKDVERLADSWPIRVITIDAKLDLVDWYEREGFVKMTKNSAGQDGTTVAMYFDCMKYYKDLQKYVESICE